MDDCFLYTLGWRIASVSVTHHPRRRRNFFWESNPFAGLLLHRCNCCFHHRLGFGLPIHGGLSLMLFNWSAHADKQHQAAASRRVLFAVGLQREVVFLVSLEYQVGL
jgi:hypothetical protein